MNHNPTYDEPSPADLPQQPQFRHVLRTSRGVIITLLLNEESGVCDLEWSECPTRELLDAIGEEYFSWRDQILHAWEQRTGRHYFAKLQIDQ
jgi:hypothetical protein